MSLEEFDKNELQIVALEIYNLHNKILGSRDLRAILERTGYHFEDIYRELCCNYEFYLEKIDQLQKDRYFECLAKLSGINDNMVETIFVEQNGYTESDLSNARSMIAEGKNALNSAGTGFSLFYATLIVVDYFDSIQNNTTVNESKIICVACLIGIFTSRLLLELMDVKQLAKGLHKSW